MLFKLAVKNLRKSFRDFAIYFFTLTLGVAIFYVFNALDGQTAMLDISQSSRNFVALMLEMLSGVSVFVSITLGLLIVYASRFLMKRRSQEFGIYFTLGMSKTKISLLLFCETLMIGVLSLGVGLTIGVALSQLMSLVVVNMFEANLTRFTFTFSASACLKTMIYFGIMYTVVMIFSALSVSRCKLIDLINYARHGEKVKMKNPWVCSIVFILAAIILGAAYYMINFDRRFYETADMALIPIVMGVISTVMVFWSFSGLILRIVQGRPRLYLRGLNAFTLRQFSSKINTTVASTSVICLMLFLTICLLSSCLTIKNSMNANLTKLAPADLQLSTHFSECHVGHCLNVSQTLAEMGRGDLLAQLGEYVEVPLYYADDLTMGRMLGSEFATISQQFHFLDYEALDPVMSVSDYNKIAAFYGNQQFNIGADEYVMVADFDSIANLRNQALARNEPLDVFGHALTPRFNVCQDGFLEMSSNHINTGIIVVPDAVVADGQLMSHYLVGNYREQNKDAAVAFETELDQLRHEHGTASAPLLDLTTKLQIKETTVGLSAVVTFIGLYLGVIFLMASATILALKELSESNDNRARFMVLRRLGVDERMLNHALLAQIAIFFGLPLLLALVHSVFGMMFATKILEVFGDEELIVSMVMTAIFIVVIYGGYFYLTYWMGKNIIRERS